MNNFLKTAFIVNPADHTCLDSVIKKSFGTKEKSLTELKLLQYAIATVSKLVYKIILI